MSTTRTIHFNAINKEGRYICVDLATVEAFWTLTDGAICVRTSSGNGFEIHPEALPEFLDAMADFRRLNGISLYPQEQA